MQTLLCRPKATHSVKAIFFRVLGGNFISNWTDRAVFIYLIWVVTKNESLFLLNVFICLSLLPHLLLLVPASRVINKIGPIRACLFSDGIKFFIYAIAAISCFFHYQIGYVDLLLISFFSNIGSAFFNPAAMSVPVFLSEASMKRQKMIALLTFSGSLSTMLGPILAMWFFYLSPDSWAIIFIFSSFMYLVSALNNIQLKLSQHVIQDESIKISSVNLLRSYPDILWLLICFLVINLVFMPIQLFIPLLVKAKFLAVGGYTLSLLEASIGFGAIVGILLLLFISKNQGNYVQLFRNFLIAACGYLAFSFSINMLGMMASLFILGMFLAIGNILTIHYYQQRITIKSHTIMVMGFVNLISVSVGPIAMAISGIVISCMGLPATLKMYAISMVVVSFGLLLTKFFQSKE